MRIDSLSPESPGGPVVHDFLVHLLGGDLGRAAHWVTEDMVFLGRHGWRGEATPFRDDAQLAPGSIRQLPPEEVQAIPPKQQREAFETEIKKGEYVFFAILKASGSRATLGIIARDTPDGFRVARLFDTKHVKRVLLSH